ncbi:MAG: NUDIX domain-containing protein [Candidatus Thorarchaeota archaeon]
MSAPKTPLITVDAVILYNKSLILIRRKNPPFKGELALPGGFVEIGETVEKACIREIYEETNVNVDIIKLIGVFSDPTRDPRGHTITIAFLCKPSNKKGILNVKAKDDASSIEIVPLDKLSSLNLAFDHFEIIKKSGILE